MKLGSKLAVVLVAVGCASTIFAEEVLKPSEVKDFLKNPALTAENGTLVAKGQTTVLSAKAVPVDPSKKYKLSGKFRAKDGSAPTMFYFGYAPYDAKNNPIISASVCYFPNTDTELAEPAKNGDTVLKVKDASKWSKPAKSAVVAFNTKADFADLPNNEIIATVPEKIENKNGVWEVTLKTPLRKAYPGGTKIRQQTYSGSYIYNVVSGSKNSAAWQNFSGIISGEGKSGHQAKQWWPGTKSARILILLNYGGKDAPASEFKDIVLETID